MTDLIRLNRSSRTRQRTAGRPGRGRGHRSRSERGATLVEYGLLVALFAIPTATAINYVRDVSKVKIERTADGISTRQAPGVSGD